MTDEIIIDDDAIDETITTPWTAQECADELGVNAKALRDVMRKYARANGLAMPGSGGRWSIDVPTDDAERSAFFDWLRDLYVSTGRSTNVTKFAPVRD
jgi:hypothetical protein